MFANHIDTKFIEFLFISRYFGIESDFFYFLRLKLSLLNIKIRKKKKERQTFRPHMKNTRLRPLVKITINLSNFLTRYMTIVFFKEEKNLSGLLIKKHCQSANPHAPSRFLKQFRSFCERLR